MLLFWALAFFSCPAEVFGQTTPAADTLAGHAQLVRIISTSICKQLTTNHTTDLAKLSSAEVMTYAQGLFINAMQADSVRLIAMMTVASERGLAPTEVGRWLGHDAMINLAISCSAARPLALRLGQTE